MNSLVWLTLAAVTFVGSHLLLSHPLRAPLVARLRDGGFLGLYSGVAAAAITWLALAYRATPAGAPLWIVTNGLWVLVSLVMLAASILFVGSLIGNPALPNPGAPGSAPSAAKGVFAITRHPMNWSFALWAGSHIAVFPTSANLILCGAIAFLALTGSALQDRKKEALQPDRWRNWESKTSFWPFAAIISGRARLAGFGWIVPTAGVVLWLAATWAHRPAAGVSAGLWRWIG
jgi:uncharacterized membrane protein